MPEPITPEQPHDEAEELLPWYATGQLEAPDRERVEAHLSACTECRQQLSLERKLIHEFRAFSPHMESGWSRLQARLAANRATGAPAGGWRLSESAGELWATLTRPVILAIATAQVVFFALASGLLLWLSEPAYHALGSPAAQPSANIVVIFRGDASEDEVRSALRHAGASIVGGPTAADAYLLRVPAQQRQTALNRLQSDDNVQLAQPIDDGSAR